MQVLVTYVTVISQPMVDLMMYDSSQPKGYANKLTDI